MESNNLAKDTYILIPGRDKPFILDSSQKHGLENLEGIGKNACKQFGVEYVIVVAGEQQLTVKI